MGWSEVCDPGCALTDRKGSISTKYAGQPGEILSCIEPNILYCKKKYNIRKWRRTDRNFDDFFYFWGLVIFSPVSQPRQPFVNPALH